MACAIQPSDSSHFLPDMRSALPRFLSLLLAVMVFACNGRLAGADPLIVVNISPESRVKAAEGSASRELVKGEWREFTIAINNVAGITSALQIESVNVILDAAPDESRDRWLHLEISPSGPLTGKSSETRKLRLMTKQSGIRSAVLNINAGQGTQDLGFRSDLLLNFKIAPPKTKNISAQSGTSFEIEDIDGPTDLGSYDNVRGKGLRSHDLYFRALNCGLRIPAETRIGQSGDSSNRMLPQADGKLSWQGWWNGFEAGRDLVSHGRSLGLTANGVIPGEVLRTKSGPLEVLIAGNLDFPYPHRSVEIIRNGRAEIIGIPALVTLNESGWFAVRAIADGVDDFHCAMSAPWYVEIAGKPMKPEKEDANFFLDWTRRRIVRVKQEVSAPNCMNEALASLTRAETFWSEEVASSQERTRVRGQILDAETQLPMPARIEIRNAEGAWFFPSSEGGSAVRYQKRNIKNSLSVENHTTLDAHPWTVDLPPGRYTITIERGKEWTPLRREIIVASESLNLELAVTRWVNMASQSWFSGETHVHRTLADLPNVMLAEDLNVAFPLTYWCLDGTEVPFHYDKGANPDQVAKVVTVDANHVIWPCNTEWEIFGIGGPTHTLGAVFALGHQTPFKLNAPPLGPVAEEARKQGALLDMDKPDWPWAMALPPVMEVNLFELSNNHVWRVPFAITTWSTPAPEWMLPGATTDGTERDWIEYTHQNYWALLNGGQRLRPSAGTASGVHPVPLGYSRVYVHCPQGFSYENWRSGLENGRSFVTTGPVCLSEIRREGNHARIQATAKGERPLSKIEIIVNGAVYESIDVNSTETSIDREIPLAGTTWIALRVWEPREDGRFRFAHTSPVWFDDATQPLHPRPEQAAFLAKRVKDEISRSHDVLPAAAIQEYQNALQKWESLTPTRTP